MLLSIEAQLCTRIENAKCFDNEDRALKITKAFVVETFALSTCAQLCFF